MRILLALLVANNIALAQQEQAAPTGYNPMGFSEFWKPQEGSGLTSRVRATKTIPQVQGVVMTAIRDQPAQLGVIAGAAIKGAETWEKAGAITSIILQEAATVLPEKYNEIATTLFLGAEADLQGPVAGFIFRNVPEDKLGWFITQFILQSPEASQPQVMVEAAKIIGLEQFNFLINTIWTQVSEEEQLKLRISLRSAFELQSD